MKFDEVLDFFTKVALFIVAEPILKIEPKTTPAVKPAPKLSTAFSKVAPPINELTKNSVPPIRLSQSVSATLKKASGVLACC